MAEEHPNMFARALDAVQNIIRPDYSQNREVQRAAALAQATDQRELIHFARKEAVDYLSKLAEIPAPDRDAHLKLERIDPGETSEWRAEDWTDKAKLVAKVEADVLAWARDNKLDLETHDDRFAAYVGVGSAYGAAHLSANFASWEEDTEREAKVQEAQQQVVERLQAMNEVLRSGDRLPAFDSRADADAFRSDVDLTWGEGTFDHMRAGNTDALIDAFPIQGQRFMAIRSVQVAWSAAERNWPVINSTLDHEAEKRTDPQEVIADARTARVATAFDEMADAVIAGERPQFRTEEQAAAFRRDVEAHYGQGAMERLRSGDSTDLSRDVSDPARVAIMGAAVRMMAETHEALRDAAPDRTLSQAAVIDRESGPDLDL